MNESLKLICPLNRSITAAYVNCAIELHGTARNLTRAAESQLRKVALAEFHTIIATLTPTEVMPFPNHNTLTGLCIQRSSEHFDVKSLPEITIPSLPQLAQLYLRNEIPKSVFELLCILHTPQRLQLPPLTLNDLCPNPPNS
jgi:hypothetical protein